MTAALLITLLLTPMSHSTSAVTHDEVLRRARVWKKPSAPIEEAKLDQNPGGPGSFAVDEVVDCTFKPGPVSGSTPKFDCELADGDIVKVKYGRSNPEVARVRQ